MGVTPASVILGSLEMDFQLVMVYVFSSMHKLCECLYMNYHTDIDECEIDSDSCDVNAECSNTYGSYMCQCLPGFSGDGQSCSGKYTHSKKD